MTHVLVLMDRAQMIKAQIMQMGMILIVVSGEYKHGVVGTIFAYIQLTTSP